MGGRVAAPLQDAVVQGHHRAVRGLELAEALGVHYQTVGYLERGEYSPSLHLAMRIARYFEVPVEVIFSTEPFPRIGQ
ncbi:helix-turn-helix transcriptional regulator [Nocardiopsis sp. YSL2]|uniref:helix-turn-helix transcriptional regulator n=1 Tax=Nocardiopsis sp. YSL2 TaxID=2939492 RepID=UPI00350E34B9